jgi:phosphosulfolactate synthase
MAADPLRSLTPWTRHPFAAIDYPAVPAKPRRTAITAVLDGGLGPAEARDRAAIAAEWIDVVKLGWATARLTPAATLRDKIEIYRTAGIRTCSGGTFLEIAFTQNRVREFLDGARDLGLAMVEVSNGVHPMSEEDKLGLIAQARAGSRSTTVARRSPASSKPAPTR